MESGIEGLELSDNVNYDRVCDLFITRKTLADARSGARLMTTKELADSLGVSVETVRTAARKLMAIRECESHGKVFQQSLITAKGRAKLALALGGGKFQELGFERG